VECLKLLEPYKVLAAGMGNGEVHFWGVGFGQDEKEDKVLSFLRDQKLLEERKRAEAMS
jgi:hypothetical protein